MYIHEIKTTQDYEQYYLETILKYGYESPQHQYMKESLSPEYQKIESVGKHLHELDIYKNITGIAADAHREWVQRQLNDLLRDIDNKNVTNLTFDYQHGRYEPEPFNEQEYFQTISQYKPDSHIYKMWEITKMMDSEQVPFIDLFDEGQALQDLNDYRISQELLENTKRYNMNGDLETLLDIESYERIISEIETKYQIGTIEEQQIDQDEQKIQQQYEFPDVAGKNDLEQMFGTITEADYDKFAAEIEILRDPGLITEL